VQMAGGGFVALAVKPEALADDCERATLVVTARPAPATCRSTVIAADHLRGQGGLALWRARDGYAAAAIRPKAVDRPWSRAVAGGTDAEAVLAARPVAARPVDATPAEADQQAED
jgi:competence protein ComEC